MFSVKALVLFSALSAQGESQLLHFSATWCQPCREMEPVIARLEQEGYPVGHVDVDRQPQIAQRFGVKSVPCFIMLNGDREVDRVVGRTSYDRLFGMFRATSPVGRAGPANLIRAQSPEPPGVAAGMTPTRGPQPRAISDRAGNRSEVAEASARHRIPETEPAAAGSGAGGPTRTPVYDRPASPTSGRTDATSLALAATVRLRIDDDRGRSYGTGTIIDVHREEALIVTCGHIFRDSQGKGRIAVDLFHPQVSEPVTGTMVGYDLDRDVGLVSIRPPVQVAPVAVAGIDHRVQSGQTVFSSGCDRGGQPRIVQGRVNSINRYTGPPNVSVSGQPVDGRSGGGLFTPDGVLIGICNAADPQDNEGLYAAAGSVHAELDRAGLGFVYRRNGPKLAQVSSAAPEAGRGPNHEAPVPMQSPATTPPRDLRAPHSSILSDDSEVICILRSRRNPQATSQVIVLEQPSGEFLDRLAREIGHDGPVASRTERLAPSPRLVPPPHQGPRPVGGDRPNPIVRGQTR